MCRLFWNLVASTSLEPSGPVEACLGIVLTFYHCHTTWHSGDFTVNTNSSRSEILSAAFAYVSTPSRSKKDWIFKLKNHSNIRDKERHLNSTFKRLESKTDFYYIIIKTNLDTGPKNIKVKLLFWMCHARIELDHFLMLITLCNLLYNKVTMMPVSESKPVASNRHSSMKKW
jgi:hypothetical protein